MNNRKQPTPKPRTDTKPVRIPARPGARPGVR